MNRCRWCLVELAPWCRGAFCSEPHRNRCRAYERSTGRDGTGYGEQLAVKRAQGAAVGRQQPAGGVCGSPYPLAPVLELWAAQLAAEQVVAADDYRLALACSLARTVDEGVPVRGVVPILKELRTIVVALERERTGDEW